MRREERSLARRRMGSVRSLIQRWRLNFLILVFILFVLSQLLFTYHVTLGRVELVRLVRRWRLSVLAPRQHFRPHLTQASDLLLTLKLV